MIFLYKSKMIHYMPRERDIQVNMNVHLLDTEDSSFWATRSCIDPELIHGEFLAIVAGRVPTTDCFHWGCIGFMPFNLLMHAKTTVMHDAKLTSKSAPGVCTWKHGIQHLKELKPNIWGGLTWKNNHFLQQVWMQKRCVWWWKKSFSISFTKASIT